MSHTRWTLPALATVLCATVLVVPVAGQEKGGTDDTGPYSVVPGWLKPVKEGFIEKGVAVFAESPDRILIATSVEFPVPTRPSGPGFAAPEGSTNRALITVVDRNGNVKDVWTQWEGLMNMPHYVTESPYDPEKAVWVISRETDQIFKFSNDGKQLLMTLGVARSLMPKNVNGQPTTLSDATHFGRPASMAFLPDGSFYVADGYTNRRVVKFDKNGKFLMEWGRAGTGPGEFAAVGEVHSIAIDAERRIYVGDRGNKRVQIFDENGKYLDEWDNIQGPSDLHATADGSIWVVSGVGNRLVKFDAKTGERKTYWGMYGTQPGMFDNPHFMSVDSEGNLYVAIFTNQQVGIEKYVPRPNADKSRLIGPDVRLK